MNDWLLLLIYASYPFIVGIGTPIAINKYYKKQINKLS
jgi:hypothetical protein